MKGKRSPRRYVNLPPIVYDPQSLDAQLATLIANQKANLETLLKRLDGQDVKLESIETQALKTNGRVNGLESWRETTKAKVAGISLAVGAIGGVIVWLIEILSK